VINLFEALRNADIPPIIVGVMMLFSMAIAPFHNAILRDLFNVNLKPSWLMFILNPSLIAAVALINIHYTLGALIALALSILVLTIIGMIWSSILSYRQDTIAAKEKGIKPQPIWKKALKFFAALIAIIIFFRVGIYAAIIIPIAIIVIAILPSNKNQYKKLQAILPTSRIRSIAMGLAEIEGRLKTITPLTSPIKNKKCIGFSYCIEKISRDNEGKKSYSTIHSETKINQFYVEDDTGKIKVIPEKLEFIWVKQDTSYEKAGKRYTQHLIRENDSVLMIGKASRKDNEVVFTYENTKQVFGISHSDKVLHYNTFKPLLNSFLIFSALFALSVALILITPIKIENNDIIISKPIFSLSGKISP